MTNEQFERLKQAYVTRVIDGMDMDSLCEYAHDMMYASLADYTQEQVITEAREYDPSLTDLPEFYACGICDHCHPIDWDGDCRDDANRFTSAALDDRYGAEGWVEVEMPI